MAIDSWRSFSYSKIIKSKKKKVLTKEALRDWTKLVSINKGEETPQRYATSRLHIKTKDKSSEVLNWKRILKKLGSGHCE